MPSELKMTGVSKRFGSVTAVDNVDLNVERGEFVTLLGPSGCGKTTMLRMMAGFAIPDAGQILIRDKDVTKAPPHQRDTSMVFQSYALFPHMKVSDNIAFGPKMRRQPAKEVDSRVREMLELTQLQGLEERYPRQLSGGQQQRVALARALIMNPTLLLLDEPLSNLDARLRKDMRYELRQLQQRLGLTTVFVTHDQEEALSLSDRVAVINEGRIQQIGTPQEIFERPKSRFVAAFTGMSNLFSGRALGEGRFRTDSGLVFESMRSMSGNTVWVGIRPDRICLCPSEDDTCANRFEATLEAVSYRGSVVEVVALIGNERLVLEIPATQMAEIPVSPNRTVTIGWRGEDALPLEE